MRPALVPCTRTWIDDDGAVRFGVPLGEPTVERHPGCTVIGRIRREIAVSGNSRVVWRLIQGMDGPSTMAEIMSRLPEPVRAVAARVVAALAATGAIDLSGRPIGRFLHLATKKGVLPGGGLDGDAVLRLATDELPFVSSAPDASPIGSRSPRGFHALTDRVDGTTRLALSRAISMRFHTSCGVTGAMPGGS
jgi:hypothetical protein